MNKQTTYEQRELYDEQKTIVPFEMAQMKYTVIVPIELMQIPIKMFSMSCMNHQIVMDFSKPTWIGCERFRRKGQMEVNELLVFLKLLCI